MTENIDSDKHFFFTCYLPRGFNPRSLGAVNVSQPTYPIDHNALLDNNKHHLLIMTNFIKKIMNSAENKYTNITSVNVP